MISAFYVLHKRRILREELRVSFCHVLATPAVLPAVLATVLRS